MSRLSRADLEGVLAFLGDAVAVEHSPAFLDHVTSRLDVLFPGTAILGSESERTEAGSRNVDVRRNREEGINSCTAAVTGVFTGERAPMH